MYVQWTLSHHSWVETDTAGETGYYMSILGIGFVVIVM